MHAREFGSLIVIYLHTMPMARALPKVTLIIMIIFGTT
jgi:hypothetical protein